MAASAGHAVAYTIGPIFKQIIDLFIYYNTITNYILIIYELSKFDLVLGVVSQIRVFGGNRTHDLHANSLAHYPLDYQGTHHFRLCVAVFHQWLHEYCPLKRPLSLACRHNTYL